MVASSDSATIRPAERLVHTVAAQRRVSVARAIENAALDLLAAADSDGATVEEIAGHAGVAVRTLYRYFATKEQILLEVPRRGAETMSAAIRARPASEAPFEALRNALEDMAPGVDVEEYERWLLAVAKNHPDGRLMQLAFLLSTEALSQALAERVGMADDDLWPEMAGTMASNALLVGQRQWAKHGGDLAAHQFAALQIAGDGLAGPTPDDGGRHEPPTTETEEPS